MTLGEVRTILEQKYEVHYKKVISLNYTSYVDAISYIQNQTSCDYDIAKQIVDEWTKSSNNVEYISPYENKQPIIKCPHCNSTKTTKITTGSKVMNTALFGLFGTKRLKEWHCSSCNSNF